MAGSSGESRRYVDSNGYVRVIDVDGICGRKNALVLEHRLVMARKIGRKLTKGEFVHHIDGNRSNNDPSNLELVTADEHFKNHKGRVKGQTRFFVPYPKFEGDIPWLKMRCPTCGRIFYRRESQLASADDSALKLTFCTPICARRFMDSNDTSDNDLVAHVRERSIVCKFNTNDDFMHIYIKKHGRRHLIDDDGIFHHPKRGYMLTKGERL